MELKSMHNQLIYKLLFTAILSLQKRRNKIFICKINNLNLYSQVFLKQYLSYIQNNQLTMNSSYRKYIYPYFINKKELSVSQAYNYTSNYKTITHIIQVLFRLF